MLPFHSTLLGAVVIACGSCIENQIDPLDCLEETKFQIVPAAGCEVLEPGWLELTVILQTSGWSGERGLLGFGYFPAETFTGFASLELLPVCEQVLVREIPFDEANNDPCADLWLSLEWEGNCGMHRFGCGALNFFRQATCLA